MKRSFVVVFSVLLAAMCLTACNTADKQTDQSSAKPESSEASEKSETTESSGQTESTEESESSEASEAAVKKTHMIDSYKDGDSIDIVSSDIYSYLNQTDNTTNGRVVETIILNTSGDLGKEGQKKVYYYNYALGESGSMDYADGKLQTIIYNNMNEKKSYTCNPDVNRYFTSEGTYEIPEKFSSQFLPLSTSGEFVVKDGCYVKTDEASAYTLSFSWDDENGGIHITGTSNDVLTVDATVTVESDSEEGVRLIDSEFEAVKNMDEIEPPDTFQSLQDGDVTLTDTSLYDIFDADKMNALMQKYWTEAKVIKKASADSEES